MTDRQAVPTTACREKRRLVAGIALALAVGAFVLNLVVAIELDALAVLDQYDVLFDADTAARLECIRTNDCGGRSSFSHPTLPVLLNPPVQLMATLLDVVLPGDTDEEAFRRGIALLVSPLASGLKAAAVFLLLLQLGLRIHHAALLATIAVVSLTAVVFGSIPESFAPAGLLLAVAYLLSAHQMKTRELRLGPWMVVGFLSAGVTLSNLVQIVFLFAVTRFAVGEPIRRIGVATLGLVVVVLVTTAGLATLFADTYALREVSLQGGADYTRRWTDTEGFGGRVRRTPAAWAHTFAAPAPETVKNWAAIRDGSKYRFRFTLVPIGPRSLTNALTFFLLGMFVAGAAFLCRAGPLARWAGIASLLLLAFNGLLHSIWAAETFLFSQHWHVSLLVLLAGPLFSEQARVRRGGTLLLSLLLLTMLFQNGVTARSMESMLRPVAAATGR